MKLMFEITIQDYVEFNKFILIKTSLKRNITIAVIFYLAFQIFSNFQKFDLINTIFSTILFILMFFLIYKFTLYSIKKIPEKNGTILGHKVLELTEDKIIFSSENSESTLNWNTVKKLEDGSKAFYLYIDTTIAIIIPKRFFKDKAEEESFKTLVNQKMIPR